MGAVDVGALELVVAGAVGTDPLVIFPVLGVGVLAVVVALVLDPDPPHAASNPQIATTVTRNRARPTLIA